MHLQVPLSGPEVPGVPGRNGDKMQQLWLNISAFIIMYFFLITKCHNTYSETKRFVVQALVELELLIFLKYHNSLGT